MANDKLDPTRYLRRGVHTRLTRIHLRAVEPARVEAEAPHDPRVIIQCASRNGDHFELSMTPELFASILVARDEINHQLAVLNEHTAAQQRALEEGAGKGKR